MARRKFDLIFTEETKVRSAVSTDNPYPYVNYYNSSSWWDGAVLLFEGRRSSRDAISLEVAHVTGSLGEAVRLGVKLHDDFVRCYEEEAAPAETASSPSASPIAAAYDVLEDFVKDVRVAVMKYDASLAAINAATRPEGQFRASIVRIKVGEAVDQ